MVLRPRVILPLLGLLIAGSTIWTRRPYGLARVERQLRPATAHSNSQSGPATSTTFALEGTAPLSLPLPQDILEQQRQQIIHYFREQIAASPAKRDHLWQPDFSSVNRYDVSLQNHRNHLREILGLIRPRPGTPQIKILQQSEGLQIEEVTIPIDSGFRACALLFLPHSSAPEAAIIAIPPADESREEFAGLVQGMTPAQWLILLLERRVAVVVPITVERRDDHLLCKLAGGKDRRR